MNPLNISGSYIIVGIINLHIRCVAVMGAYAKSEEMGNVHFHFNSRFNDHKGIGSF